MNGNSIGEKRIRTTIIDETAEAGIVDFMKSHAARWINELETIKAKFPNNPEVARLASTAQTHIETASMFSIKAATSEQPLK